ncbi:hypothetical protein GCM10029963_43680 [Micromonospora andamanensis]
MSGVGWGGVRILGEGGGGGVEGDCGGGDCGDLVGQDVDGAGGDQVGGDLEVAGAQQSGRQVRWYVRFLHGCGFDKFVQAAAGVGGRCPLHCHRVRITTLDEVHGAHVEAGRVDHPHAGGDLREGCPLIDALLLHPRAVPALPSR